MSIEDVKNQLLMAAGEVRVSQVVGATFDAAAALGHITSALEMLSSMNDPDEIAKVVAHHEERRSGARQRAKLEASHGIRGILEKSTHAEHPNGNTWRDGYVRGLEDAHAHVQSMDNVDPDT